MIILKEASPATIDYNCAAWAAEDTTKRWDPMGYYWPETVPRRLSMETLIAVYENIGYKICDNEIPETGFKKIAIYVDSSGMPKHVARQLIKGEWTSKLGDLEDVEHMCVQVWGKAIIQMKLIDLSSYGKLATIMKKPI